MTFSAMHLLIRDSRHHRAIYIVTGARKDGGGGANEEMG